MLKVESIVKVYGNRHVVDGVSFEVSKGEIVGFLGVNGAGKTTTMDIICGCLGADSGTVTIDGHDILREPELAKKNIGYLTDRSALYDDMTVYRYIDYMATLHGMKGGESKKKSVEDVIDMLDLRGERDRIIGHLSKGYKRRTALAGVLVHDPKVIVLDEPTEGLDPLQIKQFRQILGNISEQKAIFLSSHILQEIEQICDHIVMIDRGRIVDQRGLNTGEGEGSFLVKHKRPLDENTTKVVSSLKDVKNVFPISDREFGVDFLMAEHSDDFDGAVEALMACVFEHDLGLVEFKRRSKRYEHMFDGISSEKR